MGIECTLVALSEEDVKRASIRDAEQLRLGKAWDALEQLLALEAPELADAIHGQKGRKWGPPSAFGQGRLLAPAQVQSLAIGLRAIDLEGVIAHYSKLDAESVHGRFGPKPGAPTEYDDVLAEFEDVEEREEKEFLLEKLEELVAFYRGAALREDSVFVNVT